jgi:hypothetical protein
LEKGGWNLGIAAAGLLAGGAMGWLFNKAVT